MRLPSVAAQVRRRVELGYPSMLDTSAQDFVNALDPLVAMGPDAEEEASNRLRSILVVATPRLPVARLLPLAVRNGKAAIERLHPKSPEDFRPVADLDFPAARPICWPTLIAGMTR